MVFKTFEQNLRLFKNDPNGEESTTIKRLLELGAFLYYPKDIREIMEDKDPKMTQVIKEISTLPSALNRFVSSFV